MSDRLQRLREQWGLFLLLALFLVLGVMGVVLFNPHGQYPNGPFLTEVLPAAFLEHASMALAVASFIGLFIELTLQRKVVRNVFEAAIGYLLPDPIRGELRWIYGQPFLCYDHTHKVKLQPMGNGFLRLTCEVTRCFQNISGTSQDFSPGLSIEENLLGDRPSLIVNYQYQVEGEDRSKNFAGQLQRDPLGVAVRIIQDDELVKSVKIRSGARFNVFFEYQKTFRESDLDYSHFGVPTTNVTIIVDAPDHIHTDVLFSYRDADPKVVKTGPHTWKLKGVLLPLQGIRVYWWPKAAVEAWKRTPIQQLQ